MPNKQPEFTVTDRRKFTDEGELRPEVEKTSEEKEEARAPRETAGPVATKPEEKATSSEKPAQPQAPSREEQDRQHGEYRESAKSVEDELRKGYGNNAIPQFDASFDRILEPFYLTALMQLGMMPAERGAQAQVDIIGARHTIDTLGLLQEKTKGNLTSDEANVLENVIYQLRMRYIELTNAIAQSVKQGQPGEPGLDLK